MPDREQIRASWYGPVLAAALTPALLAGCGTTRWTDTSRTATEQLLTSDAIDRSVNRIDMSPFSGRKVFLDTQYLGDDLVDRKYLISALRHRLLQNGCYLRDKPEDADYVIEARAGAVGTDRNDVLIGVPEMNMPGGVPGVPSHVPEIPLVKKTNQQGVAKVTLFAYEPQSGRPVWQSGQQLAEASAKNFWVFGAGPFSRDSSRKDLRFGGQPLSAATLLGEGTSPEDDMNAPRIGDDKERRLSAPSEPRRLE